MTMTAVEGEVQPKKDQAKSGPYRELQHGLIDIARIEIRAQHRKLFNERAMKELTDNVRHVGILEPILLRYKEAGKNGYILIAGERRLRAAKGAGLLQIPARVLDVNEAQAAEIQALENLHREGLGPIEEARAFKVLLEQGKYDVAGLSERMDKSKTYVYRALAILELPENILKAIEDGRLTPAHGHQMLRVPVSERGKVCAQSLVKTYNEKLMTATELGDWIDREFGQDLANAPFPVNKPFGGEIACTACPYNTGNQGQLFDGAEKGGCTNGGCFEKKTAAYWQAKVEDVQKKHGPEQVLLYEHNIWDGQTYKGVEIKKVMPSGHRCKPGQAAVISKMGGTVWLAEKPKPTKPGAAARSDHAQNAGRMTPRQVAVEEGEQAMVKALYRTAIKTASEKSLIEVLVKEWASSWRKNELANNAGIDFKKPTAAAILRGALYLHVEEGSSDERLVLLKLDPKAKVAIKSAGEKAGKDFDEKAEAAKKGGK